MEQSTCGRVRGRAGTCLGHDWHYWGRDRFPLQMHKLYKIVRAADATSI
jgi:hypothetical protein